MAIEMLAYVWRKIRYKTVQILSKFRYKFVNPEDTQGRGNMIVWYSQG